MFALIRTALSARRMGATAALAAAASGPYLATETQVGRDATNAVTRLIPGNVENASEPGSAGGGSAIHAHHEVERLRPIGSTQYRYDEEIARNLGALPPEQTPQPSLIGARVEDLREVLRFDISPEWVTQRFSRVSTVLADLRLSGLRVPIVTGTRADDLAGTLTYSFDHGGRLQRVAIHGFTGNPAKLVDTMAGHYGLSPEPSLEAGVYTRRWNGLPVHFLRLTYAPVVYADAAHQKYTVFLELNQPDLAYGISEEARRIVTVDRHSGRW